MAYEEVQDLGTDTVFALGGVNNKTGKANPKSIEGFYLGSRTVTVEGKPSTIHVFQTAGGKEGLWGTKKLNDNLPGNEGCMMLVTYKAKVKIGGGKTQHTYDMKVDKSNRIEVNSPSVLSSGDANESFEDAGDDSGDNEESAGAAAARQASVQKMLDKAKAARTK